MAKTPVIEIAPAMPPAELNSAEIEAALREHCDEVERDQILREARRAQHMREIARMRWHIAQQVHRLENGEPLDFEEYRFQEDIYKDEATDLVIMGSVQWGKFQPLDAKIHTPEGWTTMGELTVGDLVSTPFGGSARVTHLFPHGTQPIYRVTFADGRSTEAGGDHLWEVSCNNGHTTFPAEVLTTNEIARRMENAPVRVGRAGRETRDSWKIILPEPVQKPAKHLPVDPYLLGLLLGDGSIANRKDRVVSYTSADPELVSAANSAITGWEFRQSGRYNHHLARTTSPYKRGAIGDGNIVDALDDLGLRGTYSHTKFVPEIYKEGSIEQRFAILQGLMDTDGYASKSISYNSASRQLADDVAYIVRSLGGIAKITPKEKTPYTYKGVRKYGRISYKVNIRFREPEKLFRLKRKQQRVTREYQFAGTMKLAIKSIDYIGEKPAQCIMIDHPRHLYVTDDFIVSHNSEFLICSAAAMAGMGLKVFFVLSKFEKRDKFVKQRIDPAFQSVPFYRKLYKQAEERGAKSDSVRFKHFGAGHINFVGSNSPKDFTSYAEDVAIVDEHQECIPDNLSRIDSRLSGSPWQFRINVGNPRTAGTEQNRNLAWLYYQSDQRQWHVPCSNCKVPQILGWLEHYVKQDINKSGGIVSIMPRDDSWDPKSILDMRPICVHCKSPMNRLSKEGFWKQMKPGHLRHGYQLSNLYNPRQKASELYGKYIASKHSPSLLAEFWNDQLGMAWNFDGTSITDMMLQSASTGDLSGLSPYRFIPASVMKWREAA